MEFGNLLESREAQAEEVKRPILSTWKVHVCLTELRTGDDQIR